VDLAPSIKPGSYSLMCLIHRQPMSGQITVVPESQSVPSPSEVEQAGRRQRDELVQKLTPILDKARQSPAGQVAAGTGDPTTPAVIAEFAPSEVSVPVGGSVTWNTFAFHTVAFNAQDSDAVLVQKGADGSWSLVPKAGAPAGFRTPAQAGAFPPGPRPLTVDGGTWEGSGFRNTGILASLPPQLVTVTQRFTRPGTYAVRCLVHPEMKGQVRVG
jgi:plastocyanin